MKPIIELYQHPNPLALGVNYRDNTIGTISPGMCNSEGNSPESKEDGLPGYVPRHNFRDNEVLFMNAAIASWLLTFKSFKELKDAAIAEIDLAPFWVYPDRPITLASLHVPVGDISIRAGVEFTLQPDGTIECGTKESDRHDY